MATLRISDLVKRFPKFQLGPINFELTPGTACGLLGPNGAGKSTLMNCIAGQLTPDEGKASWDDTPLTRRNWKIRERVGYVPEQSRMYDSVTVAQTLLLCSKIYAQWDSRFVSDWQQRFQLDGIKKVGNLSKGMRTKLQLLVGLAHGSELLLLDEPTAGLDPDARVDLQHYIRQLIKAKSACAIISSHLFEDIETMASHVKIIRAGRIVFDLATTELPGLRLFRVISGAASKSKVSELALLASHNQDGDLLLLAPESAKPMIERQCPECFITAETISLKQIYFLTKNES